MGFLQNLKLWLSPPRIEDPDFGGLLFMHISNFPERSYWEGEWTFPKTGTPVSIALTGGQEGPLPGVRQFYLDLPARFDQIIVSARPKLQQVFKTWLNQELPEDIFTVVKLTGFDLENFESKPPQWNISFETIGEKWLGIAIPFHGDIPPDAVVDS